MSPRQSGVTGTGRRLKNSDRSFSRLLFAAGLGAIHVGMAPANRKHPLPPEESPVTHLRCDIAIPSGLRRSRVFARLEDGEPDGLALVQARGPADATHQVVDACGHPLLTFLSERDPGMATEVIRAGFWELPETVALLMATRPGACVVDVGAQVGYYSVLLARAARQGGRVYAFEPDPENFRTLTANAALTAQIAPDAAPIECVPVALADRTGNVRLHRSDRNPGDHSLAPWPDAIDSKVVPGVTLDAIRRGEAEAARIDRPIDLLKVDVANGEAAVFHGAARALREDRPVVVVTLRLAAKDLDGCLDLVVWLVGHGYGSFRLFPPGVADPYPFVCDVARMIEMMPVLDFLKRRPPVPQLTLVAYPEPVDRPVAAG
jgi:FkbM family methyltransferase